MRLIPAVMDGSTIAANLGVNPALTIAAPAERACSLWPNRGLPREPKERTRGDVERTCCAELVRTAPSCPCCTGPRVAACGAEGGVRSG